MQKSPFFSTVLLHMKMKEENEHIPTMGVDKYLNLYWNRKFVESLNEPELIGLLCHETLHICLMHMDRGEKKNKELFNIANDLVVNCILKNESFQLPKGGLIPDYDNKYTFPQLGLTIKDLHIKSSEQVYHELLQKVPKVKISQNSDGTFKVDGKGLSDGQKKELEDALNNGDVHIYSDDDSKEKEAKEEGRGGNKLERERLVKDILAKAMTVAKQQGNMPKGLERMVEDILDSKIDWRTRLVRYISSSLPCDYDWRMPSKRGSALGIYLPKVIKESVHVVFHTDTSGSMDRDDLSQALGEMQGIIKSFPNVKIDVLVGDAEIQNTFTLTTHNRDDIVEIAKGMKGGGGTDHNCVFSHVKENIRDCKILICFTDGYTSVPEDTSSFFFDTLWLLTPNGDDKALTFGEVVKIDGSV